MYNDESEDIYVNDTISIDEDEWEEQQNDTTIDKDTNYTSKIANIDDDTTAQKKIHDIVFSHVNLQKTTILSPSQLIRSLNTTKKRQKECVKTKNINKKKRYSYLNTIEPSTTIQDTGKDDKIHDDDSIKTYIDKLTTPCVYHTLYILWLSDMIRYIHVSSIPSFTKICLSYIKDNEIYKSLQYKYNNNISLSIDTIKKYLNYIFCDRVDDTVIDLMDIKDIDNTIDTLFINIQDFIDTHGMRYTYNMMNLKDHIKNMNLLNIVTQLYALITASNIPTEDEVRSLTNAFFDIFKKKRNNNTKGAIDSKNTNKYTKTIYDLSNDIQNHIQLYASNKKESSETIDSNTKVQDTIALTIMFSAIIKSLGWHSRIVSQFNYKDIVLTKMLRGDTSSIPPSSSPQTSSPPTSSPPLSYTNDITKVLLSYISMYINVKYDINANENYEEYDNNKMIKNIYQDINLSSILDALRIAEALHDRVQLPSTLEIDSNNDTNSDISDNNNNKNTITCKECTFINIFPNKDDSMSNICEKCTFINTKDAKYCSICENQLYNSTKYCKVCGATLNTIQKNKNITKYLDNCTSPIWIEILSTQIVYDGHIKKTIPIWIPIDNINGTCYTHRLPINSIYFNSTINSNSYKDSNNDTNSNNKNKIIKLISNKQTYQSNIIVINSFINYSTKNITIDDIFFTIQKPTINNKILYNYKNIILLSSIGIADISSLYNEIKLNKYIYNNDINHIWQQNIFEFLTKQTISNDSIDDKEIEYLNNIVYDIDSNTMLINNFYYNIQKEIIQLSINKKQYEYTYIYDLLYIISLMKKIINIQLPSIPTNIKEQERNNYYVIEKNLKSQQVIYPNDPATYSVGFIKVYNDIKEKTYYIYPKYLLQTLYTKNGWLRFNRCILENEKPYRIIHKRIKKNTLDTTTSIYSLSSKQFNQDDDTKSIEQYGIWQTENEIEYLSRIDSNTIEIPVNKYGNVEICSMVSPPHGCSYIPIDDALPIMKQLGLPFAKAVIGFTATKVPIFRGVVIKECDREILLDAQRELNQQKMVKYQQEEFLLCKRLWRRLIYHILEKRDIQLSVEAWTNLGQIDQTKISIDTPIEFLQPNNVFTYSTDEESCDNNT